MEDGRSRHEWRQTTALLGMTAAVHGIEVDQKSIDPFFGADRERGASDDRIRIKPSHAAAMFVRRGR